MGEHRAEDRDPSPLERLVREPALVTGVLTAAFGVAVVFGLPITPEGIGAIVTLAGALMALLRFLLVPASEVVVQQKPGKELAEAGPGSALPTGTPVVEVSTEHMTTYVEAPPNH
ncbi:hypothetical protein INN71_02840 [Nocardioides sp. ChNu-153]|uniref:hypothetical protein n=1 Tax=Nocardioides sp. ChNu-153 TaxID=2779364 RepID=UPI002652BCDD|nr:hypothetical protein [Nocardioides sp. ChNu-153]MDN7120323.1 hypothetical protein [Nocardioides sp. ChNu-153]